MNRIILNFRNRENENNMSKNQFKQAENGAKGQLRTEAILADNFWLHWTSVDVEGRDVMVEPRKNNLDEIKAAKKKIATIGIVQSKFFEGNNEVKIAREYVEDIEGVNTDFFAIIHTDDKDFNWHNYFFTAEEITKQFKLRQDRKGKQYYIFRLTKQNTFLSNKDISPIDINSIITELLHKTDEYRNQEFIRKIESKFIDPENHYHHNDVDLWKSVEGKHIVDKLLILLSTYNGFKHILAWRQTEKISFYDKINTHTYYQNFQLKTNNSQIIAFFENVKIDKKVSIKSRAFFKGVKNAQAKAQEVIELLNASNINSLDNYKEKINIKLLNETICNCELCSLEKLNFFRANNLAEKETLHSDEWNNISKGFVFFELRKYEAAIEVMKDVPERLLNTKYFIPSFIANYNLEILRRYTFVKNNANLYYELLKLSINTENKEILKSISEHTLLNDYLRTIDDLYLKIKEYKQRRNNYSTLDFLYRQRVKLIECFNFFKGNRILLIDDFKVLCEKHIECCMISYSMQVPYRKHLNLFDDFTIKIALLYCDPINLLGYFQRNNIKCVKSDESARQYFQTAINNFLSNENVAFIKHEICYINDQTNNPDLRRKIIRIFDNICILISYIDLRLDDFLTRVTHFVSEMDFRVDEISNLAHPLLGKSKEFDFENILSFIQVLLNKNDFQGLLLANCLFCLEEKGVVFKKSDDMLVDSIIKIAIENPDYAVLRPLPKLLDTEKLISLKNSINESLYENFNPILYYEAVKSKCIENPLFFFNAFCLHIRNDIVRSYITVSENNSAYTGLNSYLTEKMNKFIECVYLLEKEELFEIELVQKISSMDDFFKFLLKIDNFSTGDSFDINWLLDISSETFFKRMNTNTDLKTVIANQIASSNNKSLHQIYFRNFYKSLVEN